MNIDLDYANDGTYGIDVMATDNEYIAGWYKISDGAGPTPTPEPTSGLLLLLGVAGLAHTCSHFASQSSDYALG